MKLIIVNCEFILFSIFKFLFSIFLLFFSFSVQAQHLTIIPTNPTTGDTIMVISEFSYYGNCSFGMVHYFVDVTNQEILIIPTYCGYGDTTLCSSVDTFWVPPVQPGTYELVVEYHQGSICPVSGFDAIIGDTTVNFAVSAITGLNYVTSDNPITTFPNPATEKITIQYWGENLKKDLSVFNIGGKMVYNNNSFTSSDDLFLHNFKKGFYFIQLVDGKNIHRKLIIVN